MAGIFTAVGGSRRRILKFLLGALVTGVIAGGLIGPTNHFFIFCLILVLGVSLVVCWRWVNCRLLLLVLFFLLVGFWRFAISQPSLADPNKIYYYNGQTVALIAKIVSAEQRINQQRLTLRTQSLMVAGQSRPVTGNILVTSGLYPQYHAGQLVELRGKIDHPLEYQGFNYPRYLARFQIYSVSFYPQLKIRAPVSADYGDGLINDFRERLINRLNASVPEPAVSVLLAMVWGQRTGVPPAITTAFSQVGLSHIVAVSGMHIAVILLIINRLLIGFGLARSKAFWLAILMIVLYVLFIGAPASAIRAALMGLIVLLAAQTGRLANSINALLLAGDLMLMVNPQFIFDVGFQLSFMATIGIIYGYPYLHWRLRRLTGFLAGSIVDMLAVTLAAQIFTLPFILWHFGGVSLVGLGVNIIVLPMVPLVIILGLFNSLVSLLTVALGRIIGIFSYLAFNYIIVVAQTAAQLPLAYLTIEGANILAAILASLGLAGFLLMINRRRRYEN